LTTQQKLWYKTGCNGYPVPRTVPEPERLEVIPTRQALSGQRETANQEPYMEVNSMDVNKILSDLRQEREQIEDAIISLERLARGRGKRRGRPPAWMKEAEDRRQTRAASAGEGEE